jgi:hypothetical protein
LKRALGGSIYLAAGALVGLVSAIMAVDSLSSTQVRRDSSWQMWDAGGTSRKAYYATAHYLLAGRLPPAPGQMKEMSASRDSEGKSIDASCTYVVSGRPSGLIWWSLAAAGGGNATPNVSGIITSDSTIFESDGSLVITVSAAPHPGNWIRPPAADRFDMLFTGASTPGTERGIALPELTISRSAC